MYNTLYNQITKSILLSLIFGFIIFGCTSIPEQEHLISVKKDGMLTRRNGDCSKAKFNDRQITDLLQSRRYDEAPSKGALL